MEGLSGVRRLFSARLAITLGVLDFTLYEIDRIVSRTVSYALVTGLVVGVYVGVVTPATKVLPFPGRGRSTCRRWKANWLPRSIRPVNPPM